MMVLSASQSRATDSTRVCSTVFRSNVERLMTLRTSAVAVCCCSELDLLVGERLYLFAVDGNHANKSILFEHRHTKRRANTSCFDGNNNCWIPVGIGLRCGEVGYLSRLLCCNNPTGAAIWRRSKWFFPTCLRKCRRHVMRG